MFVCLDLLILIVTFLVWFVHVTDVGLSVKNSEPPGSGLFVLLCFALFKGSFVGVCLFIFLLFTCLLAFLLALLFFVSLLASKGVESLEWAEIRQSALVIEHCSLVIETLCT